MKRFLYVLLVVIVAAGLVGFIRLNRATDQPIDVHVTMKEYKLVLSRTNFPAGVPIRFIFEDNGTTVHEAVLEKAGDVDVPLEMEGEETEVEDVQPGETRTAIWTIPEAGRYQLACHIPGHFEGGMVSVFVVRSGGPLISLFFEYFSYIIAAVAAILLVILVLVFINRRKLAQTIDMP